MPDISNGGVRIDYEVIGRGRPLILLHGWASDRAWWTEAGYVDDLRRDHFLLIPDLRGHGASDKPHEPAAYRVAGLIGDVLAVADAEGLDRSAIWGLSFGGWLGWNVADAFPERVAALITTGAWDPSPWTDEDAQEIDEVWGAALRRDGMQGLVDAFGTEERDAFLREAPKWARAMFLRQDPLAMLAAQSRELIGEGVPSLDGFAVPALVIAGEFEDEGGRAAKMAGRLPHGESLRLPGLGHADACAASELTLPVVRAFLDQWFA